MKHQYNVRRPVCKRGGAKKMNKSAREGGFIAHFYPAHRQAMVLRHTSEAFCGTSYPAFGEFNDSRQRLAGTLALTLFRSCAIRGRELRETLR
jgi:hypothetical protein